MNRFTHWRRHRMFNFFRGIAVVIAITGGLIIVTATEASDLNLNSLEQLILMLCFGIAVIAVGIAGFCLLQSWERSLRERDRKRRNKEKRARERQLQTGA